MVRRLDRDETSVIEGTEGAADAAVSPDGRWVAFACAKDRARTSFSLKKVALVDGRPAGKPETVLETLKGTSPNLCWASDREIVFAPSLEPTIYAVSAAGRNRAWWSARTCPRALTAGRTSVRWSRGSPSWPPAFRSRLGAHRRGTRDGEERQSAQRLPALGERHARDDHTVPRRVGSTPRLD
jgi:hypothetical protein